MLFQQRVFHTATYKPPHRSLTTLPKHPAASRDHHHKQQMTMLCEPSSQVYISRPMTKSLPSLRQRAIECPIARPQPHLSSFNPPPGNAELSLSANAGAQTGEGQEHWDTSSSQAQRSVMVAIDPSSKQPACNPPHQQSPYNKRAKRSNSATLDRQTGCYIKQGRHGYLNAVSETSAFFFFARRKHKIANVPRPTPSKRSKARRETVARK